MISEKGIRRAFESVKREILDIKNQLLVIAENQEKIEANLEESKKKVNGNSHSSDLAQIRSIPKKPAKKVKKKDMNKRS